MRTLLLLLLASTVYGSGPIFTHKDPIEQQEFENAYKDIRSFIGASNTFTGANTFNGGIQVASGGATQIVSNMDVTGKSLLFNSNGALTIQGFQNGGNGQVIFFTNRDAANNVTFAHNGSGAQVFFLNGGGLTIGPRGGATFVYDSGASAWFCVGKF